MNAVLLTNFHLLLTILLSTSSLAAPDRDESSTKVSKQGESILEHSVDTQRAYSPTSDQLIALQKQLKQNTLDATEGILTRKKLVDETKMTIAEAQRTATRSGRLMAEALERELSESVKKDYSKLTQVYRDSNALVLEIYELLKGDGGAPDGQSGGAPILETKIEEAKKLVEQNGKTLATLITEYNAMNTKFRRLQTTANVTGNSSHHFRRPGTPRRRSLTLGELCDIFFGSNTIPSLSKEELIFIATIIENHLARDLQAISKDREAINERVEKAKLMERESLVLLRRIKRTKFATKVFKMHEKMVSNIDMLMHLSLEMLSAIEPLKRNMQSFLGDVQGCKLRLLGTSRPTAEPSEDAIQTCITTFQGALKALTSVGGKMFESIFISCEISRTFGIIEIYMDEIIFEMNGMENAKAPPVRRECVANAKHDAQNDQDGMNGHYDDQYDHSCGDSNESG